MFIVKHKKIFVFVSVFLVVASLLSLAIFRIRVGIDFKGGAISEVAYTTERPNQQELEESLATLELGSVLVQPTGDLGYIVKLRDITDPEHDALLKTLSLDGKAEMTEVNFNSIGPSVGKELTRKAVIAVILVSLAIICFIAFAFRGVAKPVSSWRYGFIAIVTLLHDVIIPVGIFAVLSRFYGAEMDTLFVVAILTILGLSVSDTIVIFDRIRENIKETVSINTLDFSAVVGRSLDQSYVRSLSTSATVILVLLALFFFGPVSTKYFALMLTAGMFLGTYSSICLASPLLVWVFELQNKSK